MSAFVADDARFAEVAGPAPRLELVVATDAHEGPVYVPAEDALYLTTTPRATDDPLVGFWRNDVVRVALDGARFPLAPDAVTVVAAACNLANGMAVDTGGTLLVCEQGTRAEHARISRLDPDTGVTETLVDGWGGLRFNSPNDVVLAPDGAIWFTDPAYGHLQGFKPEPLLGDFVYRYDPLTARLRVVADDFDKPNGLAFSPDAAVLYVSDSGANQERDSFHPVRPHHVRAFDVLDGRRLANGRLFAVVTPGCPDGVKVDDAGRVYTSAADGVHVFDPCGDPLGVIRLPGVANFCFGGPDRNLLFLAAGDAVWAAVLRATGSTQRQ